MATTAVLIMCLTVLELQCVATFCSPVLPSILSKRNVVCYASTQPCTLFVREYNVEIHVHSQENNWRYSEAETRGSINSSEMAYSHKLSSYLQLYIHEIGL